MVFYLKSTEKYFNLLSSFQILLLKTMIHIRYIYEYK